MLPSLYWHRRKPRRRRRRRKGIIRTMMRVRSYRRVLRIRAVVAPVVVVARCRRPVPVPILRIVVIVGGETAGRGVGGIERGTVDAPDRTPRLPLPDRTLPQILAVVVDVRRTRQRRTSVVDVVVVEHLPTAVTGKMMQAKIPETMVYRPRPPHPTLAVKREACRHHPPHVVAEKKTAVIPAARTPRLAPVLPPGALWKRDVVVEVEEMDVLDPTGTGNHHLVHHPTKS
mmetsp:Transcript_41097/g.74100  ORF Transcript_41097/g.74100 Transcript_41097/m.74100 type:complete len:229 (+) Transcript_41097:2381-3067(+)